LLANRNYIEFWLKPPIKEGLLLGNCYISSQLKEKELFGLIKMELPKALPKVDPNL